MVTSFTESFMSERFFATLFTTKSLIFPINNCLSNKQKRLRVVLTLNCLLNHLNCSQKLFFLHERKTNIYTKYYFSDCSLNGFREKVESPVKQKANPMKTCFKNFI